MIVQNRNTKDRVPLPKGLCGRRVLFSHAGAHFVTRGIVNEESKAGFQVWKFPVLKQVSWPENIPHRLSSIALSPSEALIAGIRDDGGIEIRDLTTGRLVGECQMQDPKPQKLLFSPRARFLASIASPDAGPIMKFWDIEGSLRGEASYSQLVEYPEELREICAGFKGEIIVSKVGETTGFWRFMSRSLTKLDLLRQDG